MASAVSAERCSVLQALLALQDTKPLARLLLQCRYRSIAMQAPLLAQPDKQNGFSELNLSVFSLSVLHFIWRLLCAAL